jgi:hypothetical protein
MLKRSSIFQQIAISTPITQLHNTGNSTNIPCNLKRHKFLHTHSIGKQNKPSQTNTSEWGVQRAPDHPKSNDDWKYPLNIRMDRVFNVTKEQNIFWPCFQYMNRQNTSLYSSNTDDQAQSRFVLQTYKD